MAKFYAVKEGKKPGIYMSWDECKEQVNGYSGAVYKSFTSEDEAKAFIGKEVKKVSDDLTLLAYVDGSYNIKTKERGIYMCKVLMSIKPKYAMQILNGTKTFEYRKNRFRQYNKKNC